MLVKNGRQLLSVVLSALASVFLVVGGVYAAFTASGTTLTLVSDLSTTATTRALSITSTSASTTAGTSVRPVYMVSTMTGAGGVGGRAEFEMTTNVVLGGWANALKGFANFGAAGGVTGLASAVVAEMTLPDKTLTGGVYYPLEIEMNPGASTVSYEALTGNNVGFIYASANTNLTDFDDNGFFMNVQGLTGAAGHLLSLTSQTLKVGVGTATRYMVLSQMENGLGLGNSTTAMDLTSTATNKAVEIYTTSSSTSSTVVEPVFVRSTMTATGGTGGRARFELVNSGVTLGGYANALKAYADFSAAGSGTTGLASAFVAELKMPNGAGAGAYFPLEIEYVDQASTAISPIGSSAGFIYMAASGTRTDFDDDGYFMKVDGLTAGAGHLLSLTSQTLVTSIGAGNSGNRFLVLSQLEDGLGLGNSTTAMDLGTTATAKAVEIYTTSSSTTSGTYVQPFYVKNVMTGTGGTGGRARFDNIVQAQMATATNALKGYLEFSAAGSTTGLASAIVAEMSMPPAAITAPGTYAVLELELVCPTTWSGNNKVSLIYAEVSGTTEANFDTYGYVLDLQGVSVGSGKVFQVNNAADATHALRIRVGAADYFIMLTTAGD